MNILDYIDKMTPWKDSSMNCPVCHKKKALFFQTADDTGACSNCFEKQLDQVLSRSKNPQWIWEHFRFNLSPTGTMKDRLLALVHSRAYYGLDDLPDLLIYNLGFDGPHPLSKFVREKAIDACYAFNDANKMIEALFKHKNFTTWQQRANIAMAAYLLNPEKPKVKTLVTRMAKDASPNVRSHVADMIKDDERSWTRTLFDMLSKDTNPLVREACRQRMKNRDTLSAPRDKNPKKSTSKKTDSIPQKKLRPYNSTENMLLRYFDFPAPEKVYDLYLSHIPDLLGKKKYNSEELQGLKQNTKDSRIRLLGEILASKMLFKTLLEKLPQKAVLLIHICADKPHGLDLELAEQKCFQLMNKEDCDLKDDLKNKQPLHETIKKDPGFFLLKAKPHWSNAYRSEANFEIAINPGVLPYVRNLLPKLTSPELIPVMDVEKKVEHLHVDDHGIFETLPIILTFIGQDNLQFAKNSDKILKNSLKKMAAICKIKEFYEAGDKDLLQLKTELIADFFTCKSAWTPKEFKNIPEFIKNAMDGYFKFNDFKSHRSRDGFDHIKRQLSYHDSDKDEATMRTSLHEILKLIPLGEWVSTSNLALVGAEKELDFFPFSDDYEIQELYINMECKTHYRDRDRERKYLLHLYPLDTVTLPFIRRMMFLFGILGIVDLAYSSPTNAIYREYGKPYLTIFDGLKYVRLTNFGNYVLDRTKTFTTKVTISSGKIEIHENKTLLSIQGDDPIKRMALDAVGEPINKTSYRVNFQSFLKECNTPEEVENKIVFFRENIAENPPIIWEDFFEQLLARMNPLKQVPAMAVFKIKPDKELVSLLTTDKILKKHVTRAENYHLLVQKENLAKVKKRLALFGYFVS